MSHSLKILSWPPKFISILKLWQYDILYRHTNGMIDDDDGVSYDNLDDF